MEKINNLGRFYLLDAHCRNQCRKNDHNIFTTLRIPWRDSISRPPADHAGRRCNVVPFQADGTISHHDMYDYLHLTQKGYDKAFEPVNELLVPIL
jgi:hypothetical protein